MRAVSSPRAAMRASRVASDSFGWSFPLMQLYFVWALLLFDLHFFFGNVIAQPLVYMVHLGYPPLLLLIALNGPVIIATGERWRWFPPLLLFLIVAALTLPFTVNKALAKPIFLFILNYYCVAVATAVYVRTLRQAMPILVALIAQFVWFGAFAGTKGLVPWHPTLANYDGYGPFMVQGMGLCFFFALATPSRRMKLFLFGLAGFCVLGVVASFARGAFLSLVALVGWIWIRSPRKVMTGAGIGVAAVIVVIGASLMFEPGFFWNEMTSALEEGAEEGTGQQRWETWKVGLKVWMQRPFLGAGGGNFGAFAATHFRWGELEAFPNPNMLYGFNMHNSYLQILAEFGLIGFVAFMWALWDFTKVNRQLQQPAAQARWEQLNATWNLRYLALGLEAANLANMLAGLFYATLFMPWFYVIWIVNRMLWAFVRQPSAQAVPRRGSGARIRGIARPQ
jgi:O-antigen ligase